jgi:hypothetical protein
MMEKSTLAGEGGGASPPPFTLFTITYKVVVYAPAERADTLPLFHRHSICSLWSYRPARLLGWRASTTTLCRNQLYPPVRDYEFGDW